MTRLATICILLFKLSFSNAQSDFVVLQDQETIDELITIFKILPGFTTTTTLSTAELDEAKAQLLTCIKNYNEQIKEGFKKRGEKKRYARMYQIKSLSNYKLQFVPYLNEKGEKEVWINGFCRDHNANWKKEIVHVFDGGNCYFRVRLNVSNRECLEVGTNGYA